MDVLFAAAAVLLIAISFIGCAVPVVPGPALAFCGLLSLLPSRYAPSTQTCVIFGIVGVVVLVLDYTVPAIGAKRFNCSRWGVFGCMAGTVAGLFFLPWGVLIGPFAGAVVGELVSGRNLGASMRGGIGAFLGFVFGVMLKLTYCAACAGWCVAAFFR